MSQPPQHPFDEAVSRIRGGGHDNREQGRQFENLVKHFLQNDPLQKNEYDKIYLWREWAEAHGEPQQDAGIDLVATRYDGGVTAIQAKFYQADTPISRKDIDTFIVASGKKPFTHRLLVTTTEKWGREAEKALFQQQIPCQRIGVDALRASPIDWAPFLASKAKAKAEKKKPRPHQQEAIKDVLHGLQTADRGRLVMACGTGKTYTSLKIAEAIAAKKGRVLFLVPSLSLLSQALHAWAEDATLPLRNFVVCSDSYVGRDSEDMLAYELAIPATTDPKRLAAKLNQKFESDTERLTVVFSTYHSIDTIIDAQKKHNAPAFDIVICDEAHRTAGTQKINEQGEIETSYYLKVHDAKKLKATKRLYMTATPRIFSADSHKKAQEHEVAIYSMDSEAYFGKELHRLGFGKAVEKGLLADYKVLVLCVNEKQVANIAELHDGTSELDLEDKAKIIGCYNGLAKHFGNPDGTPLGKNEQTPMRRAVAFSTTIKASQQFEQAFDEILKKYFSSGVEENPRRLHCEVKHIDGTMNAMKRNKELDWLRDGELDSAAAHCRVLTNARCLSEGVDVPALDAVMFLNPRKSQVDVVQSVGRVMRTAPGKEYGYVIIPIVLPQDQEPEAALNDHKTYKVVWQVLQALRAHDERFNVMINQLELNKQKSERLNIIGNEVSEPQNRYGEGEQGGKPYHPLLFVDFDKWEEAILARIVKKCGEKDYWENWAADVGKIAQRIIEIIKGLLANADDTLGKRFNQFLKKLQKNLNPAVSEADAIEMLAQHIITRPVFDALFEGYAFAKKNPVSRSMQQMITLLEKYGLEQETKSLEGFYDSVRRRAAGIDNAAGKQKIMLELYDKFFAIGFKKQSEKLGIVYTPVEIVDFILQSADAALQDNFGRRLTDKNVHILDPFTGTGTFMARLLRSDDPIISKKDLTRKYEEELHANELTLLAYYIAAINIEEIYHDRISGDYAPFQGIVLTDTFQLSEGKDDLHEDYFKENSERAKKQRARKIQVIIGNPPYSAKQESANDDNPNQKYPDLDQEIEDTYARDSVAVNRNSLYDSYIRAIRWASDRIEDEGIVAFVTNGSFIDSTATDGLRKHLLKDFSAVYCFNLRGNQRTAGEISRREGGKVFGTGSRATVAITIMIKKKNSKGGKLYYHDIGDYLTREQKLDIVKQYGHYGKIDWKSITPNEQNDWINQRNPEFLQHMPMGDRENPKNAIFAKFSNGLGTSRDVWVYNSCRKTLFQKMKETISFYNEQVDTCKGNSDKRSFDATKISWSRSLKTSLERSIKAEFNKSHARTAMYRCFVKQHLYCDNLFIHHPTMAKRFFPTPKAENLVIMIAGVGVSKEFSAFMVDIIPDLNVLTASQCFALYHYADESANLLGKSGGRQDNISDAVLSAFQGKYSDKNLSKEDIFYYVYGILHSPQYKEKYAADLIKMMPRIPQVKDKTTFTKFAKAGRALAELHLNYETQPEYPLKEQYSDLLADRRNHKVKKMRFGGKMGDWDKTVIKYNDDITLTGIPLEAYAYQVNGKSAIEWIMDRYQVKTDKDSGILNDPNAWSDDPTYILSLLKRVVHVSVESVKIVKGLPDLGV